MARATRSLQRFYAAYVASLLGVGAAALLPAAVGSGAASQEVLAAGWILAGIAWIVGGFLLAPTVATYLGPGGVPAYGGAPLMAVSQAIPEANPQVLADLGQRLSRGTDLGILLALLGIFLFFAGVLEAFSLWLGIAAGVALVVLASILAVLASGRRGGPRAATNP